MLTDQKILSELEDGPPIMKTWNRLYALVLILHVGLIIGFYLLTVVYS
jgi:uncharacterized protein YneF (UPF0154 family)